MTFAARPDRPMIGALTCAISAGSSASGSTSSHAFGTNTAVVTGAVGSPTLQWFESDDVNGETWTAPGTAATQTITVSGTHASDSFSADYYCVATDPATGQTATSSTSHYAYTRP